MIKYSIIIPCHNEAGSIAVVLEEVKRAVADAEVIVVDDGSDDRTPQIVSGVEGVKLLRLGVNSGKGMAIRQGIRAAQGSVLVFMDGDGQDDPADLPVLVNAAEQGQPFVIGSKFIGAIEKGGISKPNFWGNRFMSWTLNLLFHSAITDSQSGFKAISADWIKRAPLVSTQYEIETEMLCKALKAGVRVTEVPVTRKARTAGATGFRRFRNGFRILLTILKERFTR